MGGKYQIVLEHKGNEVVFSDDFEKMAVEALNMKKMPGFKLLFARSLQGIREEVWAEDCEDIL